MLHILGMGVCHPKVSIDNHFLEALDIGTTAQWIEEKIGILERVTTLPLEYIKTTRNQDPRMALEVASMTATDMGVKAAEAALAQAGITAKDIGLLIVNGCSPRQTIPSEATRIAERLDCPAVAFDVYTACPAFALHIDFLKSYNESALPEFVLCISTAAMTVHVDYNDRSDGAIFALIKGSMPQKLFAPQDPEVAPGKPWVDGWLRIDIPNIKKQLPYELLPVYLETMENPNDPLLVSKIVRKGDAGRDDILNLTGKSNVENFGMDSPDAAYPIPTFDTTPPPDIHLGYVYEWAFMALLTISIGLIMQFKRPGTSKTLQRIASL